LGFFPISPRIRAAESRPTAPLNWCWRTETFPTRTLNVYRNDLAQQNWLNVRPVGPSGNAGAAGAKIHIYAADTNQLLWYEQVAQYDFQVATSYYGYGQTERHFGLRNRSAVDVVVEFPDGTVRRINNVVANQTLLVSV